MFWFYDWNFDEDIQHSSASPGAMIQKPSLSHEAAADLQQSAAEDRWDSTGDGDTYGSRPELDGGFETQRSKIHL